MQVLIAGHREVGRLLPMDECITVMEQVLRTLAQGRALQPLRSVIILPEQGAVGLMPSYLGEPPAVGAKVITNSYGGHGRWGDAVNWAAHARSVKLTVNKTPAAGSIAWYGATKAAPSGHVGFVEKVDSPTSRRRESCVMRRGAFSVKRNVGGVCAAQPATMRSFGIR